VRGAADDQRGIRGVGTIRKRGKKFTTDYTDGAGVRHRCDFETKGEAATWLARRTLEAGQAMPRGIYKPSITLKDYFGHGPIAATNEAPMSPAIGWLADVARTVKPKTWHVYEALGRTHLLPVLGHHQIRRIHRGHIRAFVASFLDEKTLSRATIRLIVATLRVVLSAAVEDGLILTNPAFGIGRRMKLGTSIWSSGSCAWPAHRRSPARRRGRRSPARRARST